MATKPKEGSKAEEKSESKAVEAKEIAAGASDHWQAESDLHTLHQAHKIKSDPKRHAAAKAKAKEQMAAMKAVMQAPAAPAMNAPQPSAMQPDSPPLAGSRPPM